MQSVLVAILLGGTLGYGFLRLNEGRFQVGPTISLVQGNVPQIIRNGTSRGDPWSAQEMLNHYDLLSTLAIYQDPKPDLVIWPETCYPDEWYDLADGVTIDQVPEKIQEELSYCASCFRSMTNISKRTS